MIKYSEYIKSGQWQQVATSAKRRDGYKCRICNSPHDLNVHHRSYEHVGNEVDHMDDLITLCRRCHAMFHGKMAQPVPAPPVATQEQEDDMVTLTLPLLHACASMRQGRGHAFTRATTRALGVPWPLKQGWLRGLVGKRIPLESYQAALAGRTVYAKGG